MKFSLWLILPMVASNSLAQQVELSDELGSFLAEDLVEGYAEDQSVQDLLPEGLPPINFNRATIDELQSIPWLSSIQIQSLLIYLDKNGPLVSIYELQAVPGWDLATIRLIEPMVLITEAGEYYDSRKFTDKIAYDGGLELLVKQKRRLERSKGFLISGNRRFHGSPSYWLYRFSYRAKGFMRFGVNMEKDSGERFRIDPSSDQYGPDFLSMYMQLENIGVLKQLIIGDFKAQWDQGLTIGNTFNLGQQVITKPRRVHRGLIAHTGSQEYGFLRGIGVTLKTSRTTMHMFYSRRALDAIIQNKDSVNNLPTRATSIIESGLHRTNLEISRKNNLSQQLAGIHMKQAWGSGFSSSISALYLELNVPLIPKSTSYNQAWFRGQQNFNYSGAFEYVWKNFNLYGQVGISANLGWGVVLGVIGSLSHNTETSIHLRKINPDFHSISGGTFTARSGAKDEHGVYWGLRFSSHNRWVVGVSLNLYQTKAASFLADTPSHGLDHRIRIQYLPGKDRYLNFYWKSSTRLTNSPTVMGKSTNDIEEVSKHDLGLRFKWYNGANLVLFSTLQYSSLSTSNGSSNGILVNSRVSYNLKFMKITISSALFNTDNFENRQYVYESNFPYSLSIPFYQGVGHRWYAMARLKVSRGVDFWVRIAQSRQDHVSQTGTGMNAIQGNKRTDLSFQIRYKL